VDIIKVIQENNSRVPKGIEYHLAVFLFRDDSEYFFEEISFYQLESSNTSISISPIIDLDPNPMTLTILLFPILMQSSLLHNTPIVL